MSRTGHNIKMDRIKRAIDEETDDWLTDEERSEKLELLTVCSLLLNPNKTISGIVAVMRNEHGLSDRTAFQRIKDAKWIFGDVFSTDRAIEKMKAIQRAEAAYKLAKKGGYVEGMVAANNQLIKLQQLDKDETPGAIDPTLLQPSEYRLMVNPASKGLLKQLQKSGVIDLGAAMEKAGVLTEAVILKDNDPPADDDEEDEMDPLA